MCRILAMLPLLLAFAPAADVLAEDMELSVKPLLCVTDKRNPSCEMSFLVIWRTALAGYYCLYNDFGEAPVRCWNEGREGRTIDDRTVRENFSFWMTSADPEARLAQVEVEVLRMDSDDRRRSRRTRHVWDIN